MRRRQQNFQGEVERLRGMLLKLNVMQADALDKRVASLAETIQGQRARSNRGAKAEAEAKAAASANALKQEELYGGANLVVDGLSAAHGRQLLLVDPIFEFHVGCAQQSSTLPLLLVHVQRRCYAALTTQAQDQLKACADDYLHSASLFSQLSMFGGSDATVAAAARDKAAAISNMHALLSSPQFQNSDLQRLLSLNAAYFLKYQPMAMALHSLLVEQLQRCVRMTRKLVLPEVDCGDAVWQVHAGAGRD